ncbi:hypothetical protein U9M48_000194 [Paspalum notatum var. saurae]|uniref:Uncharacterized protein n=1 Tax=Paspalum notatum var. saurae TaxID=547442 RepID=A0AAQ3PGI2_PASNO
MAASPFRAGAPPRWRPPTPIPHRPVSVSCNHADDAAACCPGLHIFPIDDTDRGGSSPYEGEGLTEWLR